MYISLLAVLGWNAETTAQNGTRQVPRLVVSITIDQLRSDFLEVYSPLYGTDGFRRVMEQGTVYESASYPMQQIDRASAVSTVITGTVPYYHSIIGQRWINRETLRPQYSTEDIRQIGIPSPTNLSVSTLGDELKVATRGEARVISISPFCDAAVLSAGHAADGALWMNEQNGQWISSQYYSNPKQDSILVISGLSKQYFRSHKKLKEYQASGLINTHVTDLALASVASLAMGSDSITDLLCLTYYAGSFDHKPVTECQEEIRNNYLLIDQSLGQLITRLEQSIGTENVLFVITSTGHSDPEHTDYARYRIPTGTFYINRAANLLNMYFGAIWGQGRYIETWFDNQLYVNHKLLEQKRVSLTDFCQRAKEFLLQMEGVRNVYTALQLLGGDNSLTAKVRNGFHPLRSGDILIEVAPGWHMQNEDTSEDRVSQASATPFPIILYGTGIKPCRIINPVTTDRIAPTISRAIRIRAPNACTSEPLY